MANTLVIDSDPGNRALMAEALAGICEVEQAANSAEALRMLAARKFTIVVLDLHVRPLDGFIVLRTLLNRTGPNQKTPVYAIAADQAEQARALREHVVYALMKPVAPATLATLVDAGIRKAEAPPPPEESPAPPSATTTPPASRVSARTPASPPPPQPETGTLPPKPTS